MIVTFLGHRDTPQSIKSHLKEILTALIEKEKADTFYVGNNGYFDQIVREVLKDLKYKHPNINYSIVLAYIPKSPNKGIYEDFENTIFPEEVAAAIPKYAIAKRNLWMVQKSDTVISYVTRSYGGAAKFKEIAKKMEKRIIELN